MINPTQPSPSLEVPSSIFNYGKWREGFLQAILIGASIFGFIALAANFITGPTTADLVTYTTAFVVLILTTIIRFPYWVKATVLLLLLYALSISGFLDTGLWGDSRVFLVVLVIMASLLFSPLAGIVATVAGTVTTIVFGWLILTSQYQITGSDLTTGVFADWLTGTLTDILVSVVIIIGLRAVQREFERAREQAGSTLHQLQDESKDLESRVQDRTNQLSQRSDMLRSSAYITRIIAEIPDIPAILENSVRLTADHFRFNHVAVYLFDEEGKTAFLQSASSEAGRQMAQNGFRIAINPKNIIGFVSEQKRPYNSATDSMNQPALLSEGRLDDMRLELAIPLTVHGRHIGVLDLQSKEARKFNEDEIDILQSLADQIAIFINSAHLIEDTRAVVKELETLTTQQTRDIWRRYLENRALAYQYTPSGTKSVSPEQIRGEAQQGIRIPVQLRGQNIGMLTFRGKEDSKWTEREQDLAEKVANQVALALDNNRLLEETRQRAIQQQTVNEISARLNRSLDIDTMLQAAARELGSLSDVAEVSVILGLAEEHKP